MNKEKIMSTQRWSAIENQGSTQAAHLHRV